MSWVHVSLIAQAANLHGAASAQVTAVQTALAGIPPPPSQCETCHSRPPYNGDQITASHRCGEESCFEGEHLCLERLDHVSKRIAVHANEGESA